MKSNQEAVRSLVRYIKDFTGNMPPLPGIFPDYQAPVVRNNQGEREPAMARWNMPSPVFALKGRDLDSGITNVRNVKSPHWRRWLGVESRCVVSRRSALNMGEYLDASERYLRMALKAQNQCRMTLETLSNIKNPPVVYAKQANIANGPQQVNNGSMPRALAEENQTQPNKLLEQSNEERMDGTTQGETGTGNSALETVAAGNRA